MKSDIVVTPSNISRNIKYACKRLANDPAGNIAGISFDCGYKKFDYFAEDFISSVGINPAEYRKRIKLWRAKRLLRRTNLSSVKIAAILAFSSSNSFRIFFKNAVGSTPKKYREEKTGSRIDPRLVRGKELIDKHPYVGIQVISDRSGYNSRTAFSQAYEMAYGITPAKHRKKLQNNLKP